MSRFLLRRCAASLLLIYLVLTFTFFFIHLAPGEPSFLFSDPRVSAEQREQMRRTFGLDQPVLVQYGRWMAAVVQGDWGLSLTARRPALELILEKLPNTAFLVLVASAVEYGVGVGFGVLAALWAGGWRDRVIRFVFMSLYAIPMFWLALLSLEWLTVRWPLFPIGQMSSFHGTEPTWLQRALDLLYHVALPALVLGLARCGAVVRYVRNGLLEVLKTDFVRAAKARGLSPLRVLVVHALSNALLPLVQRLGTSLPILLSGSLIIEAIFSWPGLGFQVYLAILQRDYPVILASTAVAGVLVVLGNLLADVLLVAADPRVRQP